MSKEFPTILETNAYDDGFADAEDYWRPKELERVIAVIEAEMMKCLHVALYSRDPNLIFEARTLHAGLEAATLLLAAEEKEENELHTA